VTDKAMGPTQSIRKVGKKKARANNVESPNLITKERGVKKKWKWKNKRKKRADKREMRLEKEKNWEKWRKRAGKKNLR